MKLELVDISADDERRAWSMLPRHVIQSTLHNELVRAIEPLRDRLETAESGDVLEAQQSIKAYRFLLGLIHRKDPLPTR